MFKWLLGKLGHDTCTSCGAIKSVGLESCWNCYGANRDLDIAWLVDQQKNEPIVPRVVIYPNAQGQIKALAAMMKEDQEDK